MGYIASALSAPTHAACTMLAGCEKSTGIASCATMGGELYTSACCTSASNWPPTDTETWKLVTKLRSEDGDDWS